MSGDTNETFEHWRENSLASLIEHIVGTHHVFCRQEVTRLAALFDSVIEANGKEHPELKHLRTLFFKMSRDLSMHLVKEEQTLFPYIVRVEMAVRHNTEISWPPFGSVEYPIRMMIEEHDQTDKELEEIRKLSGEYTPPTGASGSQVALYEGLAAFDQDMQQHIEFENHLLFPRAIAMEELACGMRDATRA